MNRCLSIFLSLLLLLGCDGYKFLLYMPMYGRSHVNFLGKITETLLDAGHDVTMLIPMMDTKLGTNGTNHPRAKMIFVPQCEAFGKLQEEMEREGGGINDIWKTNNAMFMVMMFVRMRHTWVDQCRLLLENDELIERLKAEKFDVGYNELMDSCGGGIFHLIGIKNVAITFSMSLFEGGFEITGAPHIPSYVPGMAAKWGDQMTFIEKFYNVFAIVMNKFMVQLFVNPYTELFREKFDPNFPSLWEIFQNTSLVFLNTEPLIDFPRPTTHRIVEVGGITVSSGHKELNSTWSDILNLRKQTVLLSFGTFFKGHLMPEEYKNNIRETFRQFPDVTFIWKYEKPEDDIARGVENIIPTTWVPQNDMLYDRRLSLFITHGGQGSTTEVSTAGVPVVVIPVAADQFRNGHVLIRNGMGVMVQKEELAEVGPLGEAIKKVLGDDSYRSSAKHVSSMIRNRPFSPKETFVRQMEFLARFGPLRNLDHYGSKLNFFQYYSLDVISAVSAVTFLVLYILYRATTFLFALVFRFVRIAKHKLD